MDTVVNSIINGKLNEFEYFNVQALHHETLSKAAATLELAGSSKDIPNNEESTLVTKIQSAKHAFDWNCIKDYLLPHTIHTAKSAEISKKLRERGNELYKQQNGKGALRAYTLSVAFAPLPSSEELSTAYANRSAVLLQNLKRPRDAIEDCQRALSYPKISPALKKTLEERMSKCETLLLKSTNLQQTTSEILNLFEIHDPNPKVPNMESFVQISHSSDKGRHLTVTKDVPAGTVLLADKPFVSVLNNLLSWETEHCLNCSKWMSSGIPCNHCTFALFCNEKCRDQACEPGGKHRFEHNYLPILRILNASHADIQALRIISVVGQPHLYKLWKSRDLQLSPNKHAYNGFNDKGIYDATSYLPIFYLISHEARHEEESLDRSRHMNELKALFLKQLLKEYSTFFEDLQAKYEDKLDKEGFEDFIASLILKHLESIKYNAISISKLTEDNRKSEAYAAAVYPVVSLCNHSCDPNCVPVRDPTHLVTSLISLKYLREGEELLITYKHLYYHSKTKDRQSFLAKNYRFICKCDACENRWDPQIFRGDNGTVILESTRCAACKDSSVSDGVQSTNRQCHECVKTDVARANELKEMEQCLFECHDLLVKHKKYVTCLRKLRDVLDYFGQNGYLSHFQLYHVAMDLFKRALVFCVKNVGDENSKT